MNIRIPTPLRSYTDQKSVVEANGTTIGEILADLDRRYQGMRFRIVDEQGRLRDHVKVFVNKDSVRELSTPVTPADKVTIMQALSGG